MRGALGVKKILIVLGIVIVLILGGMAGMAYYYKGQSDQINLQYDQEVKPELKRALDYSAFDGELGKMSEEEIKKLEGLILEKSIQDIQKSIEKGELSCKQLVCFYVLRIKKYNQLYNAVIQLNDQALIQAIKMDQELGEGKKMKNLTGVMVLLKDNISDKDLNTTAGAFALKDLTTKRDAFVVKQIKDQGAIVLGKANLSEWANFMSLPSSNGFSVLGGQTKNAYGRFDVGGSSSGSAVGASLDFANITFGSETAGSMIYPASQNSVVGIKPTLGLLSRDLIIPISEAQDTAGIMGKQVEDVWTVFRWSIGKDTNDPLSGNITLFDESIFEQPLDPAYLKGKRLGIVKKETKENEKLIAELRQLGADIVEVELDSKVLDLDMVNVLKYGIIHDVEKFLNNPAVETQVKSLREIYDINKKQPDKRMPFGAGLWEMALSSKMSEEEYKALVNKNRDTAQGVLDKILKDNSIEAIVSFSNDLSAIYAPATYPAVTVPFGYQKDGEPIGVTFVGSLNQDGVLLQIAYSYEQGTKHRKIPKLRKR